MNLIFKDVIILKKDEKAGGVLLRCDPAECSLLSLMLFLCQFA